MAFFYKKATLVKCRGAALSAQMLPDEAGGGLFQALLSQLHRCQALAVGALGVRSASYQQLDYAQVTFPGRQVQRQVAPFIRHVHVHPVLQEHAHGILKALSRSVMGHSETADRVTHSVVCPCAKKSCNQLRVPQLRHLSGDKNGRTSEYIFI